MAKCWGNNNCIFCGKYVKHDYLGKDGKIYRNIMVQQSGKYGQRIVAHRACYLYNQDVNRRSRHEE